LQSKDQDQSSASCLSTQRSRRRLKPEKRASNTKDKKMAGKQDQSAEQYKLAIGTIKKQLPPPRTKI
jgi:hypothetical protein